MTKQLTSFFSSSVLFSQLLLVGENLGIAAFAVTIVILVAIIAGVVWFVWQKLRDTPASPSTPNKSKKAPPHFNQNMTKSICRSS